jgi:homoserine kinase
VKVRIPASVANLGPGFDVLALAIDLWLEVEAEPADQPRWSFEGEGADLLNRHPPPLARLRMHGRVRSDIPLGVGLGSSAAARLALAALQGLDTQQSFGWAAKEEGHPDNVAAAAFGGVQMLAPGIRPLPTPEVDLALFVAHHPASTDEARKLLPERVPLADAVFNLGRMASLVDALHRHDYELLGEAVHDRLHQPYRQHLYPWTAEVMKRACQAGGYGAAISGAGPTVVALCPSGQGQRIASAMAEAAIPYGYPLVTRVAESGMSVMA